MVMLMGTAVYLRLWTIDYTVSSVDTELIRFSFINFLSSMILPFSCNCFQYLKKWDFFSFLGIVIL